MSRHVLSWMKHFEDATQTRGRLVAAACDAAGKRAGRNASLTNDDEQTGCLKIGGEWETLPIDFVDHDEGHMAPNCLFRNRIQESKQESQQESQEESLCGDVPSLKPKCWNLQRRETHRATHAPIASEPQV